MPRAQRMTRANGSASLGRAPPPVRRTLALALLALAAPTAASAHVDSSALFAAAVRQPTPVFVVSGHGWGHGVGLAQYGAYGYAKRGRVLLANGKAQLTISSKADFTVTDATGEKHDVAAGMVTLGPKLKLKVDAATKAKALPGPLLFGPGTQPLELGRPGHGRPGRAVRGPHREDVLLLHVGRPDDVRGGRLGHADPVSRLGARPVRHALALPRLGAVRLHGDEARESAPRAGPPPRRADADERFRPRGERDGGRRKRRVDGDRSGRPEGARAALDLVQRRRGLAVAAGGRDADRLRRAGEAHRPRPRRNWSWARKPCRDREDLGRRGPREGGL